MNPQQILKRDGRSNDDQKFQPPFKNNLFDEIEEQEIDTNETNNEVHLVEGRSSSSHLTLNDYEDLLDLNRIYETTDEHESISMRQYDLRPRPTGIKQNSQIKNKKASFLMSK